MVAHCQAKKAQKTNGKSMLAHRTSLNTDTVLTPVCLPNRRRTEALAKGNAYLAEGKQSLAREAFVKAVDVTPEMAFQLIKVSLGALVQRPSTDTLRPMSPK